MLMKRGHKKADILKWQVIRFTYKLIGEYTIININALPYSVIAFKQVFDATFGTNVKDYRCDDIVQSLRRSMRHFRWDIRNSIVGNAMQLVHRRFVGGGSRSFKTSPLIYTHNNSHNAIFHLPDHLFANDACGFNFMGVDGTNKNIGRSERFNSHFGMTKRYKYTND